MVRLTRDQGRAFSHGLMAVAAVLSLVSCTREVDEPSSVLLTLPPSSQKLGQTIGALTIGTWGVTDPVNIGDIDCYAILIEGPETAMRSGQCVKSDGTVVMNPGLVAGAYPAGSVIEIEVPSGPSRRIAVVGFDSASSSACQNFAATGGPQKSVLSAPHLIGEKTMNLVAGRNEVDITVSLSASGKFDHCTQFGGTAPTPNPSPNLWISDLNVGEGQSGSFAVSLSAAASQDIVITYASSDGSATAALDYSGVSGQITIFTGGFSAMIPVVSLDDSIYENSETFTISIGSAPGAAVVDGTGIGTILDNESMPAIHLSGASATEGGTVAFTVSVSPMSALPATFSWSTAGGTALQAIDYAAVNAATATIAAGLSSIQLHVATIDDALNEGAEQFSVSLYGAGNATIAGGTATLTIDDNDAAPSLWIADASADEGGTLAFIVSLSAASAQNVSFTGLSLNGTAVAGSDYSAISIPALSIPAGQWSTVVLVPLIDDGISEASETLTVSLSAPTNATIADGIGIGTIVDNDGAMPSIFVSDAFATEDGTLEFVVSLSGLSASAIVFDIATSDGTAVSGDDYSPVSVAGVSIPAGVWSATIYVPLVEDGLSEFDEFMNLTLSNLTYATAGDLTAMGTIFDNDPMPTLSIYPADASEGAPVPFLISLSAVTARDVEFQMIVFDGSAVAGSDFIAVGEVTLQIPAGSWSTTHSITTLTDANVEGPEVFNVTLFGITNANPGVTFVQGTIMDAGVPAEGWARQAFLKPPQPDSGDYFGQASALSGDTAIISAPAEASGQTFITSGTGAALDNSFPYTGAAYIYRKVGPSWHQEAFLKAHNAETNDAFGGAVAISGDDAIVGANSESSNLSGVYSGTNASANNLATTSGAAYVFKRSGSTWVQDAYIKAPNPETSDYFGQSVAISGDLLAVGATGEDSSQSTITLGTGGSTNNLASGAGAVYAFKRTGQTWTQEAYIKAPFPDASDSFGFSLALNGNLLVVGAHMEDSAQTYITNGTAASSDNTASSAGAAYVYARNGITWTQQAYLKPSNTDAGDQFGTSVAIHGETILVGSPMEDSNLTFVTNGSFASTDNSLTNSGAVYVFRRASGIWSPEAYLKASNPDANDQFGSRLAIYGDLAAVGVKEEDSADGLIRSGTEASLDNSSVGAGAVYVFKRSGSAWSQDAYLKALHPDSGDNFGSSVAMFGDTVVIGASYDDNGSNSITNGTWWTSDNSSTDAGAAYVFNRVGPIHVIVSQDPLQMDPAGGYPATFQVEFSRPIDPATFTTGDIVQSGTVSGVTWSLTNSGDNRKFQLQATTGTGAGTIMPTVPSGTVQDLGGAQNDASSPSFDNSVLMP